MPNWEIRVGEALDHLKAMPDNSVDSVVTDPPAGIEFAPAHWDTFKQNKRSKAWAQQGRDGGPGYGGYGMKLRPAFHTQGKAERDQFVAAMTDTFTEVIRVLKPGGFALVWAIPRTSHWTAWALEGSGFEVRDCFYHGFLNGMPKSHRADTAIDKHLGVESTVVGTAKQSGAKFKATQRAIDNGGFNDPARQEYNLVEAASDEAQPWVGWGTGLKPCVECWWVCRKPLAEDNLAANLLKWGVGALNVDASRPVNPADPGKRGKWPAHLALSHGAGCRLVGTKRVPGTKSTVSSKTALGQGAGWNAHRNRAVPYAGTADADGKEAVEVWDCEPGCPVGEVEARKAGASRFFWVGKPAPSEKFAGTDGSVEHPTVKSVGLMERLVRLVTPPGGLVLDPFVGSGSTGVAAVRAGFRFLGIDREASYTEFASQRIAHAEAGLG